MPELSGRTREDLQAEADLLRAKEDLAYAERYLEDAQNIHSMMVSLSKTYPDHTRFLERAVDNAKANVNQAKIHTERAGLALLQADARWEARKS